MEFTRFEQFKLWLKLWSKSVIDSFKKKDEHEFYELQSFGMLDSVPYKMEPRKNARWDNN